jgi:tetratricopeptide (TPR) repeat protein
MVMAHDVFISYSNKDKKAADAVCSFLEQNEIRCWVAPRDITPGAPFAEAIIDGIKGSKVFILIYSSNTNSSSQVIKEVDRAVHHKLAIIPLRLENVPMSKQLEYYVSDVHWLDALTPPLEKHINKLYEVVKMLLTMEEVNDNDIREALYAKTIKQAEPAKHAGKLNIYKLPVPTAIALVFISLILIITAIFVYPKILRKDNLDKIRSSDGRISVAVMPFLNLTNDTTKNILQDWIQDILISSLSNNPEDLEVRQTESVNTMIESKGEINYASITPTFAKTISRDLDANIFIYGNIKQSGSVLRLNALLTDSKTGDVIKPFQIEGSAEEKNIFPIIDSLSKKIKDFLVISKLKKEVYIDPLKIASSASPEAYRYFTLGQKVFGNRDFPAAINLLSQAVAIDSNLTFAILHIGWAYSNMGIYDEARKWCLKAYRKRDMMPIFQKTYTNYVYTDFFETPYESIKYLKQLQEIDDHWPHLHYGLGLRYLMVNQYDMAISELEKSLDMYDKMGIKPWWTSNYIALGVAYHKTAQYKKERKLYRKAEKDFPDDYRIISRKAILALSEGDTITGDLYIEKFISLVKGRVLYKPGFHLANLYVEAGMLDKAEELYRNEFTLQPENPVIMNNLAYFLIDNERNISEGLDIIMKALELRPDNYVYQDTKGWGLYKQSKYQEAFEILQQSWDLRRQNAIYDHEAFLHLEEAKKAVAGQKNN